MFKDELATKIMIGFCALRAKTYSQRLDDDTEEKKGTKKSIVKRERSHLKTIWIRYSMMKYY